MNATSFLCPRTYLGAPEVYSGWLDELYDRAAQGDCVIHRSHITDRASGDVFRALRITKLGHLDDPRFPSRIFVSADPRIAKLPLPTTITETNGPQHSIASIYLCPPMPLSQSLIKHLQEIETHRSSFSIDHGHDHKMDISRTGLLLIPKRFVCKSLQRHDNLWPCASAFVRFSRGPHWAAYFHWDGYNRYRDRETHKPFLIARSLVCAHVGRGTVYALDRAGTWDTPEHHITAPTGAISAHFSYDTFTTERLGISHAAPKAGIGEEERLAIGTLSNGITVLSPRSPWKIHYTGRFPQKGL